MLSRQIHTHTHTLLNVIHLLSRKELATHSKTELGFTLHSNKMLFALADVNTYPLNNKHTTTHCIKLHTWNKDNKNKPKWEEGENLRNSLREKEREMLGAA